MSDTSKEAAKRMVIVLNGASSVGKSSVARAIQARAREPFLHVQMDAFLAMLPPRAFEHADGLVFERIDSATIDVRSGPLVEQVLAGMRRSVAALAETDNNIVVDEVMFGEEDRDYRALLHGHDLRFIGLVAPLAVIQQREAARGDRAIGLGKGQIERVHKGRDYDLEIDTSTATPEAIASRICAAFSL